MSELRVMKRLKKSFLSWCKSAGGHSYTLEERQIRRFARHFVACKEGSPNPRPFMHQSVKWDSFKLAEYKLRVLNWASSHPPTERYALEPHTYTVFEWRAVAKLALDRWSEDKRS